MIVATESPNTHCGSEPAVNANDTVNVSAGSTNPSSTTEIDNTSDEASTNENVPPANAVKSAGDTADPSVDVTATAHVRPPEFVIEIVV